MGKDKAVTQKSDDVSNDGDENVGRGNWSGQFDFILSCIGYAVGLGNVWRFPYLAYRNGGGAFLIPYAIMLAIAGLPLFYFEMCIGQFANLGPISVWRLSPLFKGVGWAMVIISGLVCIYYNVIIGWAVYYLFASFNSQLPWDNCLNWFNDVRCRQNNRNVTNQTNVPGNNRYNPFPDDCPDNSTTNCTIYQSPAEQYWERMVLGMVDPSSGKQRYLDSGLGIPQWHLVLSLLLAWIIVYLCLIKGVKSSGKVVYFTAIFPYVVLIALLINGVLLPGARDGILFYITPKWEKLLEAKVWGDAAVQIFYSLGVAFGGLLTMASYNKFRNNCYRDALIVAILNCSTSVFAGIVIFSVIGYMSVQTGVPIEKVAQSGPGLAFVAYAEGLASMPVAPLWSILFFIMLLTLGLDSQFGMLETVISGLSDEFPFLAKTFKRKAIFTLIISVVMYLLGLTMVCQGGIYIFTLIDWYSASFSLMLVALLEVLAVMYVYGFRNFMKDVRMMLHFRPGPYWIAMWLVVSPLAIVFIFIFTCVQYAPAKYGKYQFPVIFEVLGWGMVLVAIVPIPVCMLYYLFKNGLLNVLKKAAAPEPEWGPCVEKYWHEDSRYREKLEARNNKNGDAYQIPTVSESAPSYTSYPNAAYSQSIEDNSRL